MKCDEKFYVKYRGTVLNNLDPQQQHRILAIVPDVSALLPSTWCMPCLPSVGMQSGVVALPPIGSGVWIEFEQGDPDYPIWSGCYIGSPADVPAMALAAPPGFPPIVIQSLAQNRIVVSSVPGDGIRLETAMGPVGPSIIINTAGIILSDGKGATIALAAGAVSVNLGALIVK